MGLNIKDLRISSPAFESGGALADEYSMDKGNVAPPLVISGVPREAVELAIVCHDPDAPLPHGYTHWVSSTAFRRRWANWAATPTNASAPAPTGNGNYHYDGPAPPPGHGPHHYYFWVYALDTPVSGTADAGEFLAAYADHIVEQNRIIGVYHR